MKSTISLRLGPSYAQLYPLHPIVCHAPRLAVPTASARPGIALLAHYCQLIREKGYSAQTLKNYRTAFRQFLAHFTPRLPLEVSQAEVLDYLADRVTSGLSATYQNLLINALKFYYEHVAGLPAAQCHIPRPRRAQLTPRLLTKAEVKALLQGTENLKHRAMLALAYGLGLRLNEILALLPADVDARKLQLRVRAKAHQRDRLLPLPASLLALLHEHLQQQRPKCFLFEGNQPGEAYSARSLQQVVRQAAARAGIQRAVSLHMLRHSYAAHLVEAGTAIHLVQGLLGHASAKTTAVYAQVAQRPQVASPLDLLNLSA